MKLSLRWLEEFIDVPTKDPEELADVLTGLGHAVEDIVYHRPAFDGVSVGRVEEIAPHPDADRIRVCQVDTGSGPAQIICGAWNFEEGAHVAVAEPGATLAGGLEIGRREIRGVTSHGMICSEAELGIGEDHSGILVLDPDSEVGADFVDLIELPDVVFDLEITTDRPDAMSHHGIARDLAAVWGGRARIPSRPLETVPGETSIEVVIEDGCRRFTAREIVGVEVGPSPLWVRHRLRKVGMRPVSNVVDATNYVMMELGHPLHAFDADAIEGQRLVVRRAEEGESLVTLDHELRELRPDDLVIADAGGPTSMAGTMGGADSEVSDRTTRVIMEAASWHPPTIMVMSRRHGIPSEASRRFERGVDPALAEVANRRASGMVSDLAGGRVLEGAIDLTTGPIEEAVVSLASGDVERLLGPGFDRETIGGYLRRLGFGVAGDDPLQVSVPTYRPDVGRPADLVEEVARVHGYDEFEPTLPTGPAGGLTTEQKRTRRLREELASAGLHQAVLLPFVAPSDLSGMGLDPEPASLLTVKNPLREEEAKLRPTLLPGLLQALRFNRSHGTSDAALFETGRVFLPEPGIDPRLPSQPERVAWAIAGGLGPGGLRGHPLQASGEVSLAVWSRVARSLGLRYELAPAAPPGFHPGRTAAVSVEGELIGHVGELHPSAARHYELDDRVAVAEFELEPLVAPDEPIQADSPSAFPHVEFDLSFSCGADIPAGDLIRVTTEAGRGLVESARVFDEYRGESLGPGQRALAIRYRLRAPDRTLSNEDVSPIRKDMISAAGELGARLRGE